MDRITVKEAARLLNVSATRVYKLLQDRKIELTERSVFAYIKTRKNGRPSKY